MTADTPESWPVEHSEDIFRPGLPFALRVDSVRRPDSGDEGTFRRLVLEHPGAAVVLAVDDHDRVCVLTQYRHPAGMRFVELPAGLCDHAGEDPLEVARRELQEEVELAATQWVHLASTYPSPGLLSEVHHFYLARGLTPAPRGDFHLAHEEADMTVSWVAFDDLVAAVLDGRCADGPMAIAVLIAQATGLLPTRNRGE